MQAFGSVMSITGEPGGRRFAVAECGDSPGAIAGLRARKVVAWIFPSPRPPCEGRVSEEAV